MSPPILNTLPVTEEQHGKGHEEIGDGEPRHVGLEGRKEGTIKFDDDTLLSRRDEGEILEKEPARFEKSSPQVSPFSVLLTAHLTCSDLWCFKYRERRHLVKKGFVHIFLLAPLACRAAAVQPTQGI